MSSGPASGLTGMETERVTAFTRIEAAPEAVFAVLADPSAPDIDGTGWVREYLCYSNCLSNAPDWSGSSGLQSAGFDLLVSAEQLRVHGPW